MAYDATLSVSRSFSYCNGYLDLKQSVISNFIVKKIKVNIFIFDIC